MSCQSFTPRTSAPGRPRRSSSCRRASASKAGLDEEEDQSRRGRRRGSRRAPSPVPSLGGLLLAELLSTGVDLLPEHVGGGGASGSEGGGIGGHRRAAVAARVDTEEGVEVEPRAPSVVAQGGPQSVPVGGKTAYLRNRPRSFASFSGIGMSRRARRTPAPGGDGGRARRRAAVRLSGTPSTMPGGRSAERPSDIPLREHRPGRTAVFPSKRRPSDRRRTSNRPSPVTHQLVHVHQWSWYRIPFYTSRTNKGNSRRPRAHRGLT